VWTNSTYFPKTGVEGTSIILGMEKNISTENLGLFEIWYLVEVMFVSFVDGSLKAKRCS
jgi:hypothetical protein